jgi:hypothetical protein
MPIGKELGFAGQQHVFRSTLLVNVRSAFVRALFFD